MEHLRAKSVLVSMRDRRRRTSAQTHNGAQDIETIKKWCQAPILYGFLRVRVRAVRSERTVRAAPVQAAFGL